jgi:hypothetical protein
VQLAVSGWSICWHLQPDSQTVIEVSDETGVLTGLVAGTRLPILSADAGWRGIIRCAGSARRLWTLVIGHVSAGVACSGRGPDRPAAGCRYHAHLRPCHPGPADRHQVFPAVTVG